MAKTIVHTVNARGNIFLEVVRDHFNISPARMHLEIGGMLKQTVDVLASKGIKYAELKNALTPQSDRLELALIFDSRRIDSSWYGLSVHERLLPLLHQGSSRSVLTGDYIGENEHQERLYKLFVDAVTPVREIEYKHGSQFYIVYVNNLTDPMAMQICTSLSEFEPFVGFADTTYASPFKAYLSTILPNCYIQHRNTIIGPHEDDVPNSEDWNLPGFPFEKFGYKVRSIQDTLKGVLLSYKIERPVLPGFETDTEFSLNAITADPKELAEFEIHVDPRRFDYLANQKAEILRKMGLLDADAFILKELIQRKLASNYIYSMAYTPDYDVTQFNIILETRTPAGRPFRTLVGLKYKPADKQLEVITLF